MPAVRDFAFDEYTSAVSTSTASMPTHDTNDILLCFLSKDTSGSVSETSSSGWASLYGADGSGEWMGAWWKRASGSSETAASFSHELETINIVTVSIKGAHASNDPTATNSATDSTIPYSQNASITTASANTLAVHGIGTDGGMGPTPYPGHAQVIYAGDCGANSMGVAWKFYPDASSDVDVDFFGNVVDSTRIVTVLIEDDGNNSEVQGYVASSDIILETPLNGAVVAGFAVSAWTATLSLSSIGGINTTGDAVTASADQGINPYHSVARLTPAQSATNLSGSEATLSSRDWDTGYLLSSYLFTAPRDWIDLGLFNQHKGITFTLMDTDNDYRSWIIGAKDSPTTKPDGRTIFAIQPNQSADTTWASNGTFNSEAIDTLLLLLADPYGACILNFSMLLLSGEATLAGGTSTSPIGFDQIVDGFNNGSSLFPILERSGSAVTVWNPIKIGGVDPIHISTNLRTFQFPAAYNATTKVCNFHVDADQVGVEFDGQSGDTISFSSCVFTSDSSFFWRIASTASSGASWNFSGTIVAGATVTLRPVTTFSGMAFNNCGEITLNGADITDSTIRDTRATTSQGAIAFTSASEADGIERITFIDNNDGDIGHSIRITATGTYTFDGHQFSGGGLAHFGFHTLNDVDADNDEIDHTAHGYSTGDAVYYQDQGGSDTIGLTDSNLYYVRAITADSLAFYPTKPDALADTNQVSLSDGSGGETHFIYSAKADVFNNSGGAITINITNGGDTPTVRDSDGSSTTVNNSVTLEVNGVRTGTEPTNYVRCRIEARLGGDLPVGTEIMNQVADQGPDADGNYTSTIQFNYTSAQPVTIRARYKGYIPFETTGTITSNGLSITAVWIEDSNFTA